MTALGVIGGVTIEEEEDILAIDGG